MEYHTFYTAYAAFCSDFWAALFQSLPFIFIGLLTAFIIFLNIVYPNVTLVFLFFLIPLCFGAFPNMDTVVLKPHFSKIIATHVYDEKIKDMTDFMFFHDPNTTMPLSILKHDTTPEYIKNKKVKNNYENFIQDGETPFYTDFKESILSQITSGTLITKEAIAKVFNPIFFKCMSEKNINPAYNTIHDMELNFHENSIDCAISTANNIKKGNLMGDIFSEQIKTKN
jgi:hypothetical protein